MYLILFSAILRLSERARPPNPIVLEGLFVGLRLLDFLFLSMLSGKILAYYSWETMPDSVILCLLQVGKTDVKHYYELIGTSYSQCTDKNGWVRHRAAEKQGESGPL